MKLSKIGITVVPFDKPFQGQPEVRVTLNVDEQVVSWCQVLPEHDFFTHFEKCIELAKIAIVEAVKANQSKESSQLPLFPFTEEEWKALNR